MQIKRTDKSANEVALLITAGEVELEPVREHVLRDHFAQDVKIQGFRQGKAPLSLVEKNIDQSQFQAKVLDEVLNRLYESAIDQEKIKAVDQPEVSVKKFVPYNLVEFEVVIPVLGKITLPNYKNIRLKKDKVKPVTDKEVDEVIERLRRQIGEKKDVDRAAKDGDEVYIDFEGVDSEGKPINGADGKNFPLTLGTNTFIPGFETSIVGLKPGEKKTFKLKFPKDYTVKALASKDVTFTVSLIKVQEIELPKLDAEFAAKVGPFSNVETLREDVKKQLVNEKQNNLNREYESKLLKEISSKSKLSLPPALVEREVESKFRDLTLNLSYRGQTIKDFLDQEGKTELEYRAEVLKPDAEERLKASIVLSEIAEIEKIPLTNEEVDAALHQLRAQYTDERSKADLAKPEMRRELTGRMLAEKTIAKLETYANRSK